MKLKSFLAVAAALTLSAQALSYEFSTGSVFLKGSVGPLINVVRYDENASEASPTAGLMLAVEAEYVLSNPWSLIGGFRPTFSAGSIDLKFGFGGKYRWNDLGGPLVIYTALELTPAFLLPTTSARSHFNIGLRPSFGFDYFVMRDLVLDAQIALDPSFLTNSTFRSFETSIEFLIGLMIRV